MAEMATPSAAKVATADTAAPEGKQQKQEFVKPEKPDEAVYKEGLAKFEKEHEAAREKFVSNTNSSHPAANCTSFPFATCQSLCPSWAPNHFAECRESQTRPRPSEQQGLSQRPATARAQDGAHEDPPDPVRVQDVAQRCARQDQAS